ncbi:FAD-dependent monooxygenase [Nonomuraea longicatena]|uniref:FAD-dependent monooxygenase n=1 Tax=Nonomuraea longicatena TaxID=83682 RepID=A0ABP3ZC92_9ACTN
MRTAVIVGAGIGGLTAAQALRRTGWNVAVYEQAAAVAPVGAGVGVAPNAVKALDHLGLGTALREHGQRQQALEIRLRGGGRVAGIPASRFERRYGTPFYAVHRAGLHRILMDGLDAASLHTGHRATGVALGPDAATVTFQGPQGEVAVAADLVVAADGVRSALRTALLPAYPGPTYAGYTVWRGTLPAERVARLGLRPVLSETWGRGARFGMGMIDGGRLYWFACESVPEGSPLAHDLGLLADRFARWHAPIPAIMTATPEETLLRHDVHYLHERLPSFVHGRVVLLGDAAHAVTPDIGQGACLAIEDAVTLAAALENAPAGIDAGLRLYDTLRRPRTERMARASGRLGHIMQTRNPVAALARDTVASVLPDALLIGAAGAAFTWTPPLGAT